MKIAICFSGAIRSFDDCVNSTLKYFINNFNDNNNNNFSTDIFLHAWTFTDKNDLDFNNNIKYNFKWRKDDSSIDKIINILQPKKYVIEEYTGQSENLIVEKSKIDMGKFDTEQKKNYGFNCCSMYWKILKSFELAEEYSKSNNFVYDLVIRARLDFIWEDHIKPSDFTDLIGNKIYLIKDRYATCSKLVTNDKFFAGNFDLMKKMCGVFNNLKEYQDLGIIIEGQTINENHIKKLGFDVKWIGHAKTYYKFMGRHKINPIKTSIFVNLDGLIDSNIVQTKLSNEIVYKLLDSGYIVCCLNQQIENYNKISSRFVESKMVCDFEITNYNNNDYYIIEISKNKSVIKKLVFSNLLTKLIGMDYSILIDFVQSLIANFENISIEQFDFAKLERVNQIETKEIVRYKHMDHGYYLCEYIGFESDIHIILFDNKNIKVSRDSFKIVNLIKYYKKDILPIN